MRVLASFLLGFKLLLLSQVSHPPVRTPTSQGSFDESKSGPSQPLRSAGVRGSIDAGGYAASANAKTQSELYLQLADLQVFSLARAWQSDEACTGGDALHREAVRYLAAAEYSSGAKKLEASLASKADENSTRELLGLAYEGLGQLQDAAEQFRIVAGRNHNATSTYVYAVALLLGGDTARAEAALREHSLQGDPNSTLIRLGLGSVAFETGNVPESLGLFLQAAEQDPTGTAPYQFTSVAVSSLEPSALSETIDRLRSLKNRFPHNGSAHYAYASALKAQDKTAGDSSRRTEVESELKEAVLLDPSLASGHAQLAAAYAERQELGLAAAEFRTSLDQDPRLVELHYRLGQILNRLGKPELGKTQLELHRRLRERQIADFREGKVPLRIESPNWKTCQSNKPE